MCNHTIVLLMVKKESKLYESKKGFYERGKNYFSSSVFIFITKCIYIIKNQKFRRKHLPNLNKKNDQEWAENERNVRENS